MRTSKVFSGVVALGLIAAPAFGADAPDEDSPFKIAAHTLSELHLLKLKAQVAEARKSADGAEAHANQNATSGPQPKPKLPPASVVEIGGSAGKFIAVIRMPDGRLVDYAPGQSVPGFGRIRILPNAVEDDHGKFHSPEAAAPAP